MGKPKRRRSDRAGRPVMRSPGRPPGWRREHRQRFWAAIARGLSSEAAAVEAGVSPAVGVRWFREGGGMPTVTQPRCRGGICRSRSGRRSRCCGLQGCGVREIARQLGRSPSTISRELRRNAATRSGGLEYRAIDGAVACGAARRGVPKPAKLAVNAELRRYVQDRLSGAVERPDGGAVDGPDGSVDRPASWPAPGPAVGEGWSPEQISPGCAWTSLMMSRCASRTRRSTSRCMCRAEARSGAS